MPSSRNVSFNALYKCRRLSSLSLSWAKALSECIVTLPGSMQMLSTNRAGTRQMAGQASKSMTPGWYSAGLEHVWLPYVQMKTVPPPLPVVRTQGTRIMLADGRELIDGIASWWTACHGYNHPHIRQAVEAQLASMPHVMFGGLAHEQAFRLARRLTALMPGDLNRVFFSDSGSV